MIHVGDRGRRTPGWPRTAATMPGRPRWPGRHSPNGRRRSCRGRPASSHTLRGGRDPGVDLRRRLTVGNDRCGPPSCHAMSSGVRLSTSGGLPWASRVSRTLPRHDRSLSRSLGKKRVACRQACRMGDCCSQVDPGRHAKLRHCAECTNGTWNPDDGGSVSAKMDAIEDLTSQMP